MPDQATIAIRLHGVRGYVRDPETRIEVRQASGRRLVAVSTVKVQKNRFTRVAIPDPVALGVVYLHVYPKMFRSFRTGIFFPRADGETKIPFSGAAPLSGREGDVDVFRRPRTARPVFTSWRGLSGVRFGPLKRVLDSSGEVFFWKRPVKGRPRKEISLGHITDEVYDGIAGGAPGRAKAAMLNLYGKLSTSSPPGVSERWFDFVEGIVALNRERLIARVRPRMAEIVHALARVPGPDFERIPRGDARKHFKNFPERLKREFGLRREQTVSVKTSEARGNLQLTITQGRAGSGRDVYFLDADIDENGRLLEHIIDVLFRHPKQGGTDPYDIHEILCYQQPDLDLGYRLVSRPQETPPRDH